MLSTFSITALKVAILLGFAGAAWAGYITNKLRYSSKFDVVMSTFGGFCAGFSVVPVIMLVFYMILFLIYA